MSNMAYCRFQNTLIDLKDCYEHIYDENLSDSERYARMDLIDLCSEIALQNEEEEEGEEEK